MVPANQEEKREYLLKVLKVKITIRNHKFSDRL